MNPVLFGVGIAGLGAWAVWATKPTDRSLGRHVQAVVGEAVLEVYRAALRALAAVVVFLLVLAMAWSWIEPRVQEAVSTGVHDAVSTATPHVSWLSKLGG